MIIFNFDNNTFMRLTDDIPHMIMFPVFRKFPNFHIWYTFQAFFGKTWKNSKFNSQFIYGKFEHSSNIKMFL